MLTIEKCLEKLGWGRGMGGGDFYLSHAINDVLCLIIAVDEWMDHGWLNKSSVGSDLKDCQTLQIQFSQKSPYKPISLSICGTQLLWAQIKK